MPSVKVYITIDTEEDNWGQYERQHYSVNNINALPMLQDLFDRYNAIPTYLITYPVITNKKSHRILTKILDRQRCEIGIHCHPWNTPPFNESKCILNTMLSNLDYNIIYNKQETLSNEFERSFGYKPLCFRAGRWGFNSDVAKSIHKLGLKIDTSVTPLANWMNDKGPDFLDAPGQPYCFDPDDILTPIPGGILLEVPATIGFFQHNFKRCAEIRNWIANSSLSNWHILGIMDRLRLLNFRWLSPELSDSESMIQLSKTFVKKGASCLNLSFHSTSLLPGMSPFVKDQQDLESFLGRIESFLQYAHENRFEFAPLGMALESHAGYLEIK